jgi:hypothetical protein
MASELVWEPLDVTSSVGGLTTGVYELFMARAFKRFGSRFAVFLGDGEATKANLLAAETKQTAGKGFGFLLSQESGWFDISDPDNSASPILNDGVLMVAESGFE